MNNFTNDMKPLLRHLKKECGVRFIVRSMVCDDVVLIVFNHSQLYASFESLLDLGVSDPEYDVDGGVMGFSFNGLRFHLLSKEGCG
ncbi:MAG: hypothetical protein HQL06_16810 [Nitrospirae bacterium]|nr:hypothetical protein [Nitrospirota bacterium]